MYTLQDARSEIAKKLGETIKDKAATEQYARAQVSLILNEYLRYKEDSPAVEAFKEKVRLYSEPRDFLGVPEMLTKYVGLVFEQKRSEVDPIYKALYPTVLDSISERMEDLIKVLINAKKNNADPDFN